MAKYNYLADILNNCCSGRFDQLGRSSVKINTGVHVQLTDCKIAAAICGIVEFKNSREETCNIALVVMTIALYLYGKL